MCVYLFLLFTVPPHFMSTRLFLPLYLSLSLARIHFPPFFLIVNKGATRTSTLQISFFHPAWGGRVKNVKRSSRVLIVASRCRYCCHHLPPLYFFYHQSRRRVASRGAGRRKTRYEKSSLVAPFYSKMRHSTNALSRKSNELLPPSHSPFLLLLLSLNLSLSTILCRFLSNSLLFYLLTARLHIQRTHAHSPHTFSCFFLFPFYSSQRKTFIIQARKYLHTLAEALAHVHFLLYQTIYLHLYPFKSYARR